MKVLFVSRTNILSVPGGDTMQMQFTAKRLADYKVDVVFYRGEAAQLEATYDLIHCFNITRPAILLKVCQQVKAPIVLSPIFVDYSFYSQLPELGIHYWLTKLFGIHGIEYFKKVGKVLLRKEAAAYWPYLLYGQKKSMQQLLQKTIHLLPNSQSEYWRLHQAFATKIPYTVVPNGIDSSWLSFSGNIERDPKQLICVGSIEPRKNQLNLIRAIANTDYKLFIIGSASPNHQRYYEKCQAAASKKVQFIPWMGQQDLQTYYRKSTIHILASWFETCGLVSLEAALCGCKVIVSDKGDQADYFGDYVNYCQPDDISSIRDSIHQTIAQPYSSVLKEKIIQNYTWKKSAQQTYNAYQNALQQQ